MQQDDPDIIIAGGGIAGLIATAAFAQAGYHVICVDPKTPVNHAGKQADYRATALLQPAITLLDDIGAWDGLAKYACALREMRIIDIGGESYEIRYDARFGADELGLDHFGQNVINWRLTQQLLARIKAHPNAQFLAQNQICDFQAQSEFIYVQLDDRRLRAKLLIGADGRGSPLRKRAGIKTKVWRYGQRALSFVVEHEKPHQNSSIELHRSGGPCTFVPLPDADGAHISSVVWMCDAADSDAFASMPSDDLMQALSKRSAGILGTAQLRSPISQWPIITQSAQHLVAPRLALLGEAAHAVPPIGAQGLNMSIADIAALVQSAQDYPIGSADQLRRYQTARKTDIAARVCGIDMLNRAAQTNSRLLKDLRLRALRSLHGISPLRKTAMMAGLGSFQQP